MQVLVTGAYGFIGAQIVAALIAVGHEAVCAVRGGRIDSRFPGVVAVACDMASDIRSEDWLPRLQGIDAVVNCAGILREQGSDTFEAVHVQAPQALFQACLQLGIRRVIQISALGHAGDGDFVASKHRGDEALAGMDLDWLVLRPSLVYSVRGSYGGSSLLRALAALPGVMLLPGRGDQMVQPIAAEDVGRAVVAALSRAHCTRQVVELVGPEIMDLRGYLLAWRRWLGFPPTRAFAVPMAWVRVAATIGDRFGKGPLGRTMMRMLERGNVGAIDASGQLQDRLGVTMQPLLHALAESPSQVQDRWHARLYFWLPALRFLMAVLWLGSGVVGWLTPASAVVTAAQGSVAETHSLVALARITASVDLLLGVLCLLRWRSRYVLGGMLLMLLGYTVAIGVLWPVHWMDPMGGLLKNLPLIAALAVLLATDERR